MRRKLETFQVAFWFLCVSGTNLMAGDFYGVGVPNELINILNNIISLLTDKKVVIPATVIAGAIGMYELMFSGTKGGEKLGKALIGGALILAIASIVKSAFGG